EYPIDLVYGEPIDFSDFKDQPDTRENHLLISQRCMDAIAKLAAHQQAHGVLKLSPPCREEALG
ncbi:MAG: hypothetical protein ACI8S6_002695, partial [Myxococcota bacterium]